MAFLWPSFGLLFLVLGSPLFSLPSAVWGSPFVLKLRVALASAKPIQEAKVIPTPRKKLYPKPPPMGGAVFFPFFFRVVLSFRPSFSFPLGVGA